MESQAGPGLEAGTGVAPGAVAANTKGKHMLTTQVAVFRALYCIYTHKQMSNDVGVARTMHCDV